MSQNYPSDWDSRRKEVYKRDNYTCQNCGAKGGRKGGAELHAHHIVPKSKGGTHQLTNLKTVCSQCHSAIHGDEMARSAKSTSNQNSGFADLVLLTGTALFVIIGITIIPPIIDIIGALPSFVQPIFSLFVLAFWFGVPILFVGFIGSLK